MKEQFLGNELFLSQLEKDLDILVKEELQELKGGVAMEACACCCMESNGGGKTVPEI